MSGTCSTHEEDKERWKVSIEESVGKDYVRDPHVHDVKACTKELGH
jgi:hypothetical protein